jgi:hypothetical protein
MPALACLQHWYTSLVYFAPLPILGAWLGLSNRRERSRSRRAGPDGRASG